MTDYTDLFRENEPDPLLRELDGNVMWYWEPMNPQDVRPRQPSAAPFHAAEEIRRLREALARYVCDCSDLCQLYDGWCEEGKELLPRMVCGQWARDALGDAGRAEVESKPFEERWDNA